MADLFFVRTFQLFYVSRPYTVVVLSAQLHLAPTGKKQSENNAMSFARWFVTEKQEYILMIQPDQHKSQCLASVHQLFRLLWILSRSTAIELFPFPCANLPASHLLLQGWCYPTHKRSTPTENKIIFYICNCLPVWDSFCWTAESDKNVSSYPILSCKRFLVENISNYFTTRPERWNIYQTFCLPSERLASNIWNHFSVKEGAGPANRLF